jgi:hypothetical protein
VPFPGWLIRGVALCTGTTLLLAASADLAVAQPRGPAAGLCRMDTTRGAVPAGFALDACVDASAVWLRNQLDIPVRFTVGGDTGHVVNVQSDTGIAASVTRAAYPDPLIVLPGDTVRVSVGAAAASVTAASTDIGGFYLIAVTVATFIPFGKVKDYFESFTTLVKDVAAAYADYRNCMATANWIGQLGCRTKLAGAVTFAFGKAVVLGLAKAALSVILNTAFYLQFVKAQAPDVERLALSDRTISLAARGAASTPPPPAPSAAQPLPPVTGPTTPAPPPPPQVVPGLHYNCPNDNSNIGKYVPPGRYWQNDFIVSGSTITGGFVLVGANDDGSNHTARVGIYTGPGMASPLSTVDIPVHGYGGQNFTLPNSLPVTPGQRLYLTVVGVGDFTAYDNRSGCFIGRVDGRR